MPKAAVIVMRPQKVEVTARQSQASQDAEADVRDRLMQSVEIMLELAKKRNNPLRIEQIEAAILLNRRARAMSDESRRRASSPSFLSHTD